MNDRKVLFLVNESSGRVSEEGADWVETTMGAHLPAGHEPEFVFADVPELIDRAANHGADVVATVGGDGTIGAIASGLVALRVQPLFVPLPFGTANLIPRDLGLPLDPAEALIGALEAPDRRIDYAAANGKALLHSAVFGTFAEVAEEREEVRAAKTFGERFGAATAAASRLFAAEPTEYRITVDGAEVAAATNAVFVTNNAISRGDNGVPRRDRLDAGELFVYVSDSKGPFGFMQRLLEATTGDMANSDGIVLHHGRKVCVRTTGAALIYARDGEVVEGEAEAVIEMSPGALRVPDMRH